MKMLKFLIILSSIVGKCMQTLTTFICIDKCITVHSNSASASNATKGLAADKHNNMICVVHFQWSGLRFFLYLTMGALVLVTINFDRQ